MSEREWWRGAVIYQIYPRSFQDNRGDGIGDLAGICARLDHVADLGVDAIWISPFFTSPMADMGYDISDFRDVDPIFGSLRDFDVLVSRAHDLGLKVMIDQVLSHCSSEHPFFKESRCSTDNDKADWFVWADPQEDGSPPTNWQSVFGGPSWEWEPRRKQYYMHNFLISQPQFNFHNPEVRKWHLSNLRFWLDRGVDGFRLDSVNYHFHDDELTNNPPCNSRVPEAPMTNTYGWQQHDYDKSQPENLEFLQELRKVLDGYSPVRATVGEIGDGDRSLKTMAAYTRDNRLNMAYSFELLGKDFSVEHFRKTIEEFEDISDGKSWPSWAFSNHDVPRHVSRWAEHAADPVAFAKLCAALLLSLKGTICIYQGEELGLPQADLRYDEIVDPVGLKFWPADKGRDGCRTPMPWKGDVRHAGFTECEAPWLPVKPPHYDLAVDNQTGDPDSVLEFYRAFLGFRAEQKALLVGDISVVETSEDDVLAFERTADGDRMLCVFNLGTKEAEIDLSDYDPGALEVPGFSYTLDDGALTLGAHQVFFARLAWQDEAD